MNRAAQEELFKDAERLAYDAIKFSDLRKSLSSAEWEAAAEAWGKVIMSKVDELIESELIEQQEVRVA